MCLAVPGYIKSIDDCGSIKMAKVDFAGVIKDICIEWLPEATIGDYVLAHVGIALAIIDEKSAIASLDAFAEIETLLKQEEKEKRPVG